MREFDLLERVYAASAEGAPKVLIGPGDDMALLRAAGRDVLAAVDQLIAGRHFVAATTTPTAVGRKAVARSLSDIAAMAARPLATLAAVTLPPGYGSERAWELFEGLRTTAQRYGCPLVGGDIAFHAEDEHPLVCSVTVLAEPGVGGPRTRSAAEPGDTVYVTGTLGGAIDPDGGGRHLVFEPRIVEALALAEALGSRLHAMIDVSDGLGRDASHIAEASGHGIDIDAATIPLAPGVEGWRRAASDGEDYELLFTASGDVPAMIGAEVPVTAVGRVRSAGEGSLPRVLIRDGARTIGGDEMGWEHEAPDDPPTGPKSAPAS